MDEKARMAIEDLANRIGAEVRWDSSHPGQCLVIGGLCGINNYADMTHKWITDLELRVSKLEKK